MRTSSRRIPRRRWTCSTSSSRISVQQVDDRSAVPPRRNSVQRGRYREAENAYAAVIEAGPDSGYYEQGLYKHGWSLFKQSRGEESVVSFLKLIDRVLVADGKLRERDTLPRPERELTDDAFRAIAITYSDLDGPETLDAALRQRGDPLYAHLLYENLGNLYMEKERYQDAALAYEAFAKRRPGRSFRAVTANSHDRGVPEGRLRIARARRQAGVRRALRVRLGILAAAHALRMRRKSRRSSNRIRKTSPSTTTRRRRNRRSPRTTPPPRAGIARCSTRSRRTRKRRHPLPVGRSAVRVRAFRRSREGIRAHRLRLSAACEVGRGRLRRARRVSKARADDHRRIEGAVASPRHRKRGHVRDQLP